MDIAYGMLAYFGMGTIKVSLLYRFTVLGAFAIILLRRKDFDAWLLQGFFVLFLFCQSIWLVSFGKTNLFWDFQYFTQALYPFVISFMVFHCLEKAGQQGEDLTKLVFSALIAYGIVASCSQLFTLFTGIGYLTYGEWAFGYKSFFNGGNDVGLTLLLILTISWSRFWQVGTVLSLLWVLMITVAIMIIGSRASYGGAAAVTLAFSLSYVLFKRSTAMSVRFFKVAVVVIVVGSTAAIAQYIYDNFADLIYQYERLAELLSGESPRATLEKAAWEVIDRRDQINDVFGQGSRFVYQIFDTFYLSNPAPRSDTDMFTGIRLVEADLMDMYGIFGWLLGGAFVLFHVFYLSVAVKLFLNKQAVYRFAFLLAIALFIVHGVMAGHALMSAQVATPIGALYGILRFKLRYPDKGKAF